MLTRMLNLDRLYSDGHDAIALPRAHYQNLQLIVQNLTWVADPGGAFARVPQFLAAASEVKAADQFEQERLMNASSLSSCPQILADAISNLLGSPEVMGNWLLAHRAHPRFISVWDGAEDLDWHWDGPAGADFFFLIYLNSDMGWNDSEGGQLQVGRRSLEGNYLHVAATDVEYLGTYQPASRTLVCCNNQNPQFVHKVFPLTNGRERTVLMIGFDMARLSS